MWPGCEWLIQNWWVGLVMVIIALPLVVLYYVLLVRAILEMLPRKANTVLLAFSVLAVIPIPPLLILGVLMIIIWKIHKGTLPEAP